jgi:UDP-N-acetylmuramyl pentapeptide phosphotransferase/UDP-N-acetylglucosamine-1-phosphate transferase
MPPYWQNLLRESFVLAFYVFAFWRMVKADRGSKVIECGGIAILLVLAIGFLSKSNAPNWLMASLFILLLLVGFLTVGLYIQKGYRALRHRLGKSN